MSWADELFWPQTTASPDDVCLACAKLRHEGHAPECMFKHVDWGGEKKAALREALARAEQRELDALAKLDEVLADRDRLIRSVRELREDYERLKARTRRVKCEHGQPGFCTACFRLERYKP